MKNIKKIFLLLCVAVLCMSIVVSIPIADTAQAEDARYTKKVVSVVFDDSGSMGINDRYPNARYALQMLLGLLSEEDDLTIVKMNDKAHPITVNLNNTNREAEIDRVITASFTGTGGADGVGTPGGAATKKAVDILSSKGMKTKENLLQESKDTEYWLVILTDGEFDPYLSMKRGENEKQIEYSIGNYPSLHTIYVGFDPSKEFNLALGNTLDDKYKFQAYEAKGNEIVTIMQKVASQISGRYELTSKEYTVSGNKITIDLSNSELTYASISAIVQNCNASLTSATYNGTPISVSQATVIDPKKGGSSSGSIDLKNGYSAVIKGNPYLSGGVLELTYNASVSNVTILAEPALYILPVLQYKDGGNWVTTDMQYINSNMRPGESVRINYEVYDSATKDKVDITKIFGDAKTSVTYAGATYQCGQEMMLVKGTNEIGVSVSVMDEKYTMYASFSCEVMENPSDYRVEVKSENINNASKTMTTLYSLYVDGKEVLDGNVIKSYNPEVTVTDPNGQEISCTISVNDRGITVTSTLGKYGTYTEYVKVTSPKGLSRDLTTTKLYAPNSVVLGVTGGGFTATETEMTTNTEGFTFTLSADGEALDFDSGLVNYVLTLDGEVITGLASVSGNTLTYSPRAEDFLKGMTVGEKIVSLTVSGNGVPIPEVKKDGKFTVTESTYVLTAIDSGDKDIDRFRVDESTAVIYFKLERDGKTLSKTELSNMVAGGQVKIEVDSVFNSGFLPPNTVISVEEYKGEAVVAVRPEKGGFLPVFTSMFVFGSEKPVTATFRSLKAEDNFVFTPAGVFEYVWRILVIYLIVHLILFIIGFFKVKSLPTGTFVKIYCGGSRCSCSVDKKINFTFKDKWLWHYKRLLPWTVFKNQDGVRITDYFRIEPENGRARIYYIGEPVAQLVYEGATNETAVAVEDYLDKLRSYNGGYVEDFEGERGSGIEMRELFSLEESRVKAEGKGEILSEGTYYANVNGSGLKKISEVLVFVKKY